MESQTAASTFKVKSLSHRRGKKEPKNKPEVSEQWNLDMDGLITWLKQILECVSILFIKDIKLYQTRQTLKRFGLTKSSLVAAIPIFFQILKEIYDFNITCLCI
jgi:hypothetical protein